MGDSSDVDVSKGTMDVGSDSHIGHHNPMHEGGAAAGGGGRVPAAGGAGSGGGPAVPDEAVPPAPDDTILPSYRSRSMTDQTEKNHKLLSIAELKGELVEILTLSEHDDLAEVFDSSELSPFEKHQNFILSSCATAELKKLYSDFNIESFAGKIFEDEYLSTDRLSIKRFGIITERLGGIKTGEYLTPIEFLVLHLGEKFLQNKESSSSEAPGGSRENVVLIDLYAREKDKIKNDEDGSLEVHTVVLWKALDDVVFLIDSTNSKFSRILCKHPSDLSKKIKSIVDVSEFIPDGDIKDIISKNYITSNNERYELRFY